MKAFVCCYLRDAQASSSVSYYMALLLQEVFILHDYSVVCIQRALPVAPILACPGVSILYAGLIETDIIDLTGP